MKIAIITDKTGSAIDRLAEHIIEKNPHLEFRLIQFHPKRPDPQQIADAMSAIQWCDIIDFHYWKSAVTIREKLPQNIFEGKKMILTHTNEHNVVGDWPWQKMKWDQHITLNEWQTEQLKKQGYDPTLIRLSIRFDDFDFVTKLTEEKTVGYVGQIKKVKGVREIKKACDELGYRFIVVGNVSERGYWEELEKSGMEFYTDVSNEDLPAIYRKMRVYCNNSDDGTESGTMPTLEAMASGIPVISRKTGVIRDIGKHDDNMFIRQGKYTDIEDLKHFLKMAMEDTETLNKFREQAWREVRRHHWDLTGRDWNKLYHKVMYGNDPIVSIVMPTTPDRIKVLQENIEALSEQTYENFELVISNDSSSPIKLKERSRFPVKQVMTNKKYPSEYGLAKARNVGIIESIGEIIVFCDDRLKMHPEAINSFVKALKDRKKTWVWGSKSGKFKSFVENFSAIHRRDVVNGGMFNERIDAYGGMTQEVSHRFGNQGFEFDYVPGALAEPIIGTHSKSRNRKAIVGSKIKLAKLGL